MDRNNSKKVKWFIRLAFFAVCCAAFLVLGKARADALSDAEETEHEERTASFLWITDLQECSFHPGEYAAVAEWCNRLMEEQHVSFLMGTGDYVGKWYADSQWAEVSEFLDTIDSSLPSLYIAGNHDYRLKTSDFSPFLDRVYGNASCSGDDYYEKGRGRYAIVKDGGLDWLIIGMSYGCGAPERAWISGVLEQYPDYPAILLFHDYLESNGQLAAPGKRVYDDVIMTHRNVRLVLCGHNHGTWIRTDRPDGPDGRFVQSVMYNLQERRSRRGCVQLLQIDVSSQIAHLLCQSPIKTKIKPLTAEFPVDLRGFSGE